MGRIDLVGTSRMIAMVVDNSPQRVTTFGSSATGNSVETFPSEEFCDVSSCPIFSSYHFSSDNLFSHSVPEPLYPFWGFHRGIIWYRPLWFWSLILKVAHKASCKLGDDVLLDGIIMKNSLSASSCCGERNSGDYLCNSVQGFMYFF